MIGFTYVVFKTTCLDRGRPLREGGFFFAGIALLPPLDERNLRDGVSALTLNQRAILARRRGAGARL